MNNIYICLLYCDNNGANSFYIYQISLATTCPIIHIKDNAK